MLLTKLAGKALGNDCPNCPIAWNVFPCCPNGDTVVVPSLLVTLIGVLAIVDNASAVLFAISDTVSIPLPIAWPTGVNPPTGSD